MSMTTKKFHLAGLTAALVAAGLMVSPLAFANGDHGENTVTGINQSITHSSSVHQYGDNTNNSATQSGSFMRGANGNIGVNNAAGSGNEQANDAAFIFGSHANSDTGGTMVRQGSSGTTYHQDDDEQTNTASLGGNALDGASGNIGVNDAAGGLNQQGNSLTVMKNAKVSSDSKMPLYTTNQTQSNVTTDNDGTNNAGLHSYALYNANGNVGVNAAAGGANAQANALTLISSSTLTGVAAGGASQSLTGTNCESTSAYNSGANTASLDGNALQNASGNIGVNVAAGSSNLQSNVTTFASNGSFSVPAGY